MTAKEYLKQAYLLDKQIQVEVKELEQLREMRGTDALMEKRLGQIPIEIWKHHSLRPLRRYGSMSRRLMQRLTDWWIFVQQSMRQ